MKENAANITFMTQSLHTQGYATRVHEEGVSVRSYIFPVAIERDEDVWRAYVPELEEKGAATWGHTQDEALKNLQEVVQMVIEEMLENASTASPS